VIVVKPFLFITFTIALCVLLARWQPPAQSYRKWLRDYLLFIFGFLACYAGAILLFRRIGLAEYASGHGPIYIVIGLVTAIGAATKAPLFWNVTSNWSFWASMSEGWRQGLCVVLGLLITVGGLVESRQERAAYRACENWYASARTPEDSATVARAVPDTQLRHSPSRFDKKRPAPFTCGWMVK
jgi:hypothetical protein